MAPEQEPLVLSRSPRQPCQAPVGLAGRPRALLGQADAFVVVSWWQEKSSDGRAGDYEYEHRPTLNDALDTYRDYEDGEFRRARAIGIFAVKDGLPIGGARGPRRSCA